MDITDKNTDDDFEIDIAEVKDKNERKVPTGAVPWIGGKTSILDFLLPLIPYGKAYIEPFGGSGAVILARKQSNTDVYNDIDESLVNFFQVLQNAKQRKLLLDRLEYTLYARAELDVALDIRDNADKHDKIDRAWSFFVCCNQLFGANILHQRGSWGYGRDKSYSQPKRWQSRIHRLTKFIARLKQVYIENIDAIDCIKRYESKDAVFYCDPPYILDSRKDAGRVCYRYEQQDEYHVKLLEVLLACKCAVVISGYHNQIYDDLLKNWTVSEKKKRVDLAGCIRGCDSLYDEKNEKLKKIYSQEVVWRNARAIELCNDLRFF